MRVALLQLCLSGEPPTIHCLPIHCLSFLATRWAQMCTHSPWLLWLLSLCLDSGSPPFVSTVIFSIPNIQTEHLLVHRVTPPILSPCFLQHLHQLRQGHPPITQPPTTNNRTGGNSSNHSFIMLLLDAINHYNYMRLQCLSTPTTSHCK